MSVGVNVAQVGSFSATVSKWFLHEFCIVFGFGSQSGLTPHPSFIDFSLFRPFVEPPLLLKNILLNFGPSDLHNVKNFKKMSLELFFFVCFFFSVISLSLLLLFLFFLSFFSSLFFPSFSRGGGGKGGPEWEARIFALFSLFRHHFHSFSLGLLVGFWWCFWWAGTLTCARFRRGAVV